MNKVEETRLICGIERIADNLALIAQQTAPIVSVDVKPEALEKRLAQMAKMKPALDPDFEKVLHDHSIWIDKPENKLAQEIIIKYSGVLKEIIYQFASLNLEQSVRFSTPVGYAEFNFKIE